ncbi:MAG: chitinase [Clostridia bacterium]|nr:chitinase [Clostridia bacterium]
MIKAGYVWAYALDGVTDADARMLNQINLAFGHVKDGVLSFRVRDEKNFTDNLVRIRGVNPDMKITLSVGGWGAGGFSEMAMTDEGRRAFAASCLEVVNRYALDGIDVDWEYPTIDWAGIGADPADRENFTYLLQALRDVLPDKLVTIAAGCGGYINDSMDLPAIEPILDYVSLMSYDMRGIGTAAGPHTALYSRTGAVDDYDRGSGDMYVKLFAESGIPRSKQILGAAFYSRKWEGVPDGDMHGLGQKGSTKESGGFGPNYGKLAEEYIGKNGYELYRDNGAPYLYKKETGEFICFDDPTSVAEKTKYVKDNGLAGIMYWEHSCDPTKALLTAIHEADKE